MVLQRRRRNVPSGVPSGIEGTTPDGSLVQVDLSTGRRELLFLTSTCRPCRAVWASLDSGGPASRAIVITPSASTENRRSVEQLAPAGVLVVMSSPAWFSFAPGPAPWRIVLFDGAVVSSSSAVAAT